MSNEPEILTLPNQKSSIKWTSYLAVGIAEGFEQPNENDYDYATIEAWAVIIKYSLWKGLQGWFGRNVEAILETEYITTDGVIDWVKCNTD